MKFLTALFVFALVFVWILVLKNDNTYRNHKIIGDAIHRFKMDLIKHHQFEFPVDYEDMEPYDKTLFRIWDWGYSRILPPEKMHLIMPYITKN